MKRMLRIFCVCLALSMLCGCDMQPPSEESTPTMPTLSVTLTTTSATTTTVTTSVTAPTQTTQEAYVSQRPIETTTVTYKMTTPTAVFITYNETDTGRTTTQDGLVLEYEVHRIGYNSGYESVTRKAQVVGYVGESTTVRIPATIDQYSITGVTFNEPLSIKEIYLDGMHADISSWKMPYLEDIWLLSNHSLWLFCAERYDEAGNVTRAALSCPTVHIPAKWSDNIWLYLCEDRDAPDREEQTSNIVEKLLRNDAHSVQYMAEFYKQKYLENRGTEFVDQLMLKGQKGFVDYSVYTVAENGGFDYAYPTAGRYCCKVSYE